MPMEINDGLRLLIAALAAVIGGLFALLEHRSAVDPAQRLSRRVEAGTSAKQAALEEVRRGRRRFYIVQAVSTAVAAAVGWLAVPPLKATITRLFGPSSHEPWAAATATVVALVLTALFLVVWRMAAQTIAVRRSTQRDSWSLNASDRGILALRSRGQGSFGHIQKQLLTDFFHYREATVGSIAIPTGRVAALSASLRNRDALQAVEQLGFTRYPVFDREHERVIGIVHFRDVIDAAGRNPSGFVTEYMHTPLSVPASTPVSDALKTMSIRKTHLAIIVDEHGRSIGLTSIEDVLNAIIDEPSRRTPTKKGDPASSQLWREAGPGVYEVNGDVMVGDLLDALGVELEPTGVETVGSYVFGRLGRKPQAGDSILVGEIALDVLEVAGTEATLLRARRTRSATTAH